MNIHELNSLKNDRQLVLARDRRKNGSDTDVCVYEKYAWR